MKTSQQQPLSPSARQRGQKPTKCTSSSPVAAKALRDQDENAVIWPKAWDLAARISTKDDFSSAAYERRASGPALLSDVFVEFKTNALIVVESGEILLESAQCPAVIRKGDSALIPAGKVHFSKIPQPGCEVRYWIIFFGPDFLREFLDGMSAAEALAMQVAPVSSGIYIQHGTLQALCVHRPVTPVCDLKNTFNVLLSMQASSVFMFLKEHFYVPRLYLQTFSFVRPEEVDKRFPDGLSAFLKSFDAYHGISVEKWQRQQRK